MLPVNIRNESSEHLPGLPDEEKLTGRDALIWVDCIDSPQSEQIEGPVESVMRNARLALIGGFRMSVHIAFVQGKMPKITDPYDCSDSLADYHMTHFRICCIGM